MVVPLDLIRAFHNAFRKDLAAIDAAACAAAQGKTGQEPVIQRYHFFNEVLAWHAHGEEISVFVSLEKVAPLLSEAYERDHRGLDALHESLHAAVNASDKLEIARATRAFNFFSTFHLNKEEAHLYRVFDERVSLPEQWAVLEQMSQSVPRERFPEIIRWLYPLISPADQENMTRIFQRLLPAQFFTAAAQIIRTSIGDGWTELARRIPELK